MPRNVQDIIPQKRSIRDIPIPEGRRRINMVDAPMQESPLPPPPRVQDFTREEYVEPKKPRHSLWFVFGGLLVLIALVFGGLTFFNGATITYVPRTASLSFASTTFSATKNADTGSGKLAFSVIQVSDTKTASAPASGSETVSTKASGTIIIYNDSSSVSQKLIANTRFATPDGKIYRISKAVSVPSKGSTEAVITADQPGADYNIPLSDFTIPGLQGTPQYTSVYARSKTPMTGGFSGTRGKVNDVDLKTAEGKIESDLATSLAALAQAQVPDDFILVPSLSETSFDTPLVGTTTSSNASVSEKGNFAGVMFKKADLSQFLAGQKLGGSALTAPITILDYSKLTLAAAGANDPSSATTVNFSVSGTATAEWITNEASLKSDLAGKEKSTLPGTLESYPSILSASAVVRPFWKSSFPSDATKIKIVKNGPTE